MNEDKLREAFQKVKEDMVLLKESLTSISLELSQIKRTFIQTNKPTDRPTLPIITSTVPQRNPTEEGISQTNEQHVSDKDDFKALKTPFSGFSTGNKGVPTDRQTDQQTDRQTPIAYENSHPKENPSQKFALDKYSFDSLTEVERVAHVVNSLDALRKDLRRQFKQLTSQEMLVFSTIYQLSDLSLDIDYSMLAQKTGLTESSIRDYVLKLLRKGIPIQKKREKNKKILLSVSPEFKRIASLETLISLRNL